MFTPSVAHSLRRHTTWASWKTASAVKGGQHQWDGDGPTYIIYFYDGPEIHLYEIWQGDVGDSEYDQTQNDTDKADFESHYKSSGNAQLEPKAADGRMTVRITTAKQSKNFKLRAFTFYTALAGVHSINPITDAAYGDATLTFWKKVDGVWSAAAVEDATKTVVDWDPLYAFEVIGGWVDLPLEIKDGSTNEWYLSCVGVPDYAAYGLAVDFVSEVNIEAVQATRVVSDGRATQYLSPTIAGGVNYHTNRLRWIIKHPVGVQQRFQILVETFV